MARVRLGVLISGRGSNLQALIDACADPAFPAEVALVVSNQPDAQGLNRARAARIPVEVINHRAFNAKEGFEAALDSVLDGYGIQLVCLAGFMRLLTPWFVERWLDCLINVHPSLLPSFKGLDTHARVLEAGVRVTGCTVHFVRPAMDDGPIIVQAAVPVLAGDTPARLGERVLEAEHRCYPLAVRLLTEGRVQVVNERVEIAGFRGPGINAMLCPSG
ncbi:phosphoribosylglycinamide formyltransferase 1 [uncultured Gammaproteobacteria bacterium]